MTESTPPALHEPAGAADWAAARDLAHEYAGTLGIDLRFQDFERELAEFETRYTPPAGAFFLAVAGGQAIGCAGLRLLAPDTAEMKRLYLRPAARGRGLGQRLVDAVIARSRAMGCRRLVLDTLPQMHEAQALYASRGFRPIPPYCHNPVPGARYLELAL